MLSILLAVMMIATLALTGCGQNNDPAPTPRSRAHYPHFH